MVNGSDRVTLTSGPNSLYSECPGDIVFTCQANRLSGVFWWINSNATPIARYTAIGVNVNLPINLTTSGSIQQGLVILLTNVVPYDPTLDSYTSIACTTTHNIYNKNISKLWCGQSLLNASLPIYLKPEGTFNLRIIQQANIKSRMSISNENFLSCCFCTNYNGSLKCFQLCNNIEYQIPIIIFYYNTSTLNHFILSVYNPGRFNNNFKSFNPQLNMYLHTVSNCISLITGEISPKITSGTITSDKEVLLSNITLQWTDLVIT